MAGWPANPCVAPHPGLRLPCARCWRMLPRARLPHAVLRDALLLRETASEPDKLVRRGRAGGRTSAVPPSRDAALVIAGAPPPLWERGREEQAPSGWRAGAVAELREQLCLRSRQNRPWRGARCLGVEASLARSAACEGSLERVPRRDRQPTRAPLSQAAPLRLGQGRRLQSQQPVETFGSPPGCAKLKAQQGQWLSRGHPEASARLPWLHLAARSPGPGVAISGRLAWGPRAEIRGSLSRHVTCEGGLRIFSQLPRPEGPD